jgi:hypothetical protein
MSFKVGDMVKYEPQLLTEAPSFGYIVEMGNNGYSDWAKVRFFDNSPNKFSVGNGHSLVYVEKLVKV